jgi:ribonuclease R
VHIADVAHYVALGGAIDREARVRGTSTYLPGEVLRMLPERLSADLCSLHEGVLRPARTVSLTYAPDGARRSFHIERSVVRSARTLTYRQVRRVLSEEEPDALDAPVLGMLREARALHELLRARRKEEGSLDFTFPEVRVQIDDRGEVAAVLREAQDFSHHMIEEFMLEANRAVAELCAEWELPALYRIHEEPDDRRLSQFSEAARAMGFALKPPLTRQKLQAVVERAYAQDVGEATALALLQALKLARYFERAAPHYALAFGRYLHFTSPIRRYPDLIVHRALEEAFEPGRPGLPRRRPADAPRAEETRLAELAHLAAHCSLRERAAAKAEEALKRFRQLEFLRDHREGIIEGVVRGTDEHGLTVELAGSWVRARAPLSELPRDRYRFIEVESALKGKRTRTYRPGDRVRTRVVEVDMVSLEARVHVLPG